MDETWCTDVTSQEVIKKCVIKSWGHPCSFSRHNAEKSWRLFGTLLDRAQPKTRQKGEIFLMMHVASHRIWLECIVYPLKYKKNALVLCKVNSAKVCGPDVAPNWLVKEYAQILHSLLLEPWTPPLRSSGCPVFGIRRYDTNPQKSNLQRTCKKDLRLITLTSCIAKIAEDFALLIKSSQQHCKY